jgi:hypothetical protein
MLFSLGMASPFTGEIPWWASLWPRTTAATRLPALVAACFLLEIVSAQTLPYVPTTILLPGSNTVLQSSNISNEIAYIFSPQNGSVELLALNVSSTVQASALSYTTLSAKLPFLNGDSTPFTPTVVDNGSIVVFSGNCSSLSAASIWSLDPANDGAKGTWAQEATSLGSVSASPGPGFLGGSLSFSTTLEPVMSPADVYVYGGMCPTTGANGTLAQSQATYTNQMVKLSRTGVDSSAYSVRAIPNKGAPIAEAGFTLTELSPSISNGSGTVTQQSNYVLLGGHTQTAFVNISTAAIWSLPEESWGFVSIGMTSTRTARTKHATKIVPAEMDARSGHTAVLNENGTALIVLGGWVGDTQTAASPQLAILEIGAGYGGNGDWLWSVPAIQPSGSGVYGHGAVLLPGNIMMIYGGYSISSSGATSKRQAATSTNVPMFLNLTSMSWSGDYVNPNFAAIAGQLEDTSSDPSEDAKRRLGLGLGLGLGFGAILAAVAVYIVCHWHKRHKYSAREKVIRSLAQGSGHFLPGDPMMERDDGGGMSWYTGGHDPFESAGRSLGFESLRAGRGSIDGSRNSIYGNEPTYANEHILQNDRRSIAPRAAKGQHQSTTAGSYDQLPGGRGGRSGAIHPIYEADEDGETHVLNGPSTPVRDVTRDSGNYSDPFVTPTNDRPFSFPPPSRGSLTPSPERQTDPDVQDWMIDVDAADALLTSRMASHSSGGGGRTSPIRRNTVKSNRSGYNADDDSRTNSNLSESNRSNVSRSGSIRTHLHTTFGIGAAAVTAAAAAEDRQGTSSSSSSAPSYHTAKSIAVLQAEGPSLLMGRNENRDQDDTPGSPSKNKPRRSWLGSFRRVFSGPTPTSTPSGSGNISPARDSMAEASDYDPRLGGLGSIAAAGGLLKRKSGRGDWEALHGDNDLPHGRKSVLTAYGDDDDWDIEKAVEKRLVQVMFSVPKERLRVVNGEPEIDSGESVIVVDPDEEDEAEVRRKESVKRYDLRDEGQAGGSSANLESNQGLSQAGEHKEDKGKQRETVDSALGSDVATGGDRHASGELLTAAIDRHDSPASLSLLGPACERHHSHNSDHSEGAIMAAEEVRFERPRTKVLEMVDSIESRSRSGSPERL